MFFGQGIGVAFRQIKPISAGGPTTPYLYLFQSGGGNAKYPGVQIRRLILELDQDGKAIPYSTAPDWNDMTGLIEDVYDCTGFTNVTTSIAHNSIGYDHENHLIVFLVQNPTNAQHYAVLDLTDNTVTELGASLETRAAAYRGDGAIYNDVFWRSVDDSNLAATYGAYEKVAEYDGAGSITRQAVVPTASGYSYPATIRYNPVLNKFVRVWKDVSDANLWLQQVDLDGVSNATNKRITDIYGPIHVDPISGRIYAAAAGSGLGWYTYDSAFDNEFLIPPRVYDASSPGAFESVRWTGNRAFSTYSTYSDHFWAMSDSASFIHTLPLSLIEAGTATENDWTRCVKDDAYNYPNVSGIVLALSNSM